MLQRLTQNSTAVIEKLDCFFDSATGVTAVDQERNVSISVLLAGLDGQPWWVELIA